MDANSADKNYQVVVAIRGREDFHPLLQIAYALAKGKSGWLTVVTVRQTEHEADWLNIPTALTDVPIKVEVLRSDSPGKVIQKFVRKSNPDLLVVGWKGPQSAGRRMLGRTLDHLFLQSTCNLMVVRADADWPSGKLLAETSARILVPMSGGPNAPLAMNLAASVSKESRITALHIMPKSTDNASMMERERWLAELTKPWAGNPGFQTKVIQADSVLKSMVSEAANHDMTILGATKVSVFNQLLFGAIPHKIAQENEGTTVFVKQVEGNFETMLRRMWWQATHFLPKLSMDERIDAYKQIRRGARPKIDFFMMIALATGIAALGLLLNSPAVIIGAMLVAPLMSAIVGIGLGMVQADGRLLGLSVSAGVRGMSLAIVVGAVMGFLLQSVSEPNSEILARTSPNLLDLGVALISGFAGAYALCRKNLSSSLPGVAIAVALVPPLATAGIGISWLDWQIASGALVLFLTNMVAISAASGFVFFLLGFRPDLRHGRQLFKRAVFSSVVLLLIMGAVLWWISIDNFRAASRNRIIDEVLATRLSQMEPPALLKRWEVVKNEDDDDNTLRLEVEVQSINRTLTLRDVTALQSRVAGDLQAAGVLAPNQPFALVLVVIPTTALDPFVPPTSTPLPTMTNTPTPGPSPTSTPTREPSPLPTFTKTPAPTFTPTPLGVAKLPSATPEATLTPALTATTTPGATSTVTFTPSATFTPSPTFTPAPALAVVSNTGGRGVKLRWTPGGPVAGALAEGAAVQLYHQRETVDGIAWAKVTDTQGRAGWVAAGYLEAVR